MWKYLPLLSLSLLLLEPSAAQTIPNAQACTAEHAVTGQLVPVRQRTGFSSYWAHAQWDQDGWPSITYGSTYFALPPLMQVFTSAHECGHLVEQTTNEFEANCFALANLDLTIQEFNFIANYHHSIGPLPLHYGGSGTAFWKRTVQMCP